MTQSDTGIRHPFAQAPAEGDVTEIAEGILWLRLPLPMALDHVNVFALDDGDGWTVVDTGFASDRAKAIWERAGNVTFDVARIDEIERVTRHARDAEARTPGAIERPFVPDAPKSAGVRYPPKGADECPRHVGEWVDACRICNAPRAVDEEPEDRTARRTERTSNYAEHVQTLRALARKEDAHG